MACRAVRRAVSAAVVGFVIGAHWIIRADGCALENIAQDAGKSRRRSNEAAERALRSGGRRVNQDSTPGRGAAGRAGQGIDALLQRACRVAAVEGDFRHKRVRQTV